MFVMVLVMILMLMLVLMMMLMLVLMLEFEWQARLCHMYMIEYFERAVKQANLDLSGINMPVAFSFSRLLLHLAQIRTNCYSISCHTTAQADVVRFPFIFCSVEIGQCVVHE